MCTNTVIVCTEVILSYLRLFRPLTVSLSLIVILIGTKTHYPLVSNYVNYKYYGSNTVITIVLLHVYIHTHVLGTLILFSFICT